jgi:hypothetical protein
MREIQKLEGGTLYQYLSASDPCGAFAVRCDRHPDYYAKVDISLSALYDYQTTLRSVYDAAAEALAQCPTCIEEKKPKPMCSQEEHDACGCQS